MKTPNTEAQDSDEPKRKIPKDAHSSDEDDLSPPVTTTKITEPMVIPSTLDAEMDELERVEQNSPTRTVTPPYLKEQPEPAELYSNIASRLHQISQQQTEEPNDNTVYHINKTRSLTLWLDQNVDTTTVMTCIAVKFQMDAKDCLVGVQKDTRVKSSHKYTIILKTDEMVEYIKYQGVTVEGKRYWPRSPKPRPPPRKRCFIQNFPIAATPALLASTVESEGVDVIEVIARTAPKTDVKIGGWILWAKPDSEQPEVITFDGAEYAMIWSKRGTKRNDTDTAAIEADTNTVETAIETSPPQQQQQPEKQIQKTTSE